MPSDSNYPTVTLDSHIEVTPDSQMVADKKLVEEMRRHFPSKLKAKLSGDE
jgi:hypothetical protein